MYICEHTAGFCRRLKFLASGAKPREDLRDHSVPHSHRLNVALPYPTRSPSQRGPTQSTFQNLAAPHGHRPSASQSCAVTVPAPHNPVWSPYQRFTVLHGHRPSASQCSTVTAPARRFKVPYGYRPRACCLSLRPHRVVADQPWGTCTRPPRLRRSGRFIRPPRWDKRFRSVVGDGSASGPGSGAAVPRCVRLLPADQAERSSAARSEHRAQCQERFSPALFLHWVE